MNRTIGAVPGVVALLGLVGSALGDSLGSRYPELRSSLQARVDAVPGEGATADQRRERSLLVDALACLDRESATLATDVLQASKAMDPVEQLGLFEDGVVGPLVLGFRDDLAAAVRARRDSLGALRVYAFEERDLARFDRVFAAADAFLLAAGDPSDPAAMFPSLRSALRQVAKGERLVARLSRPRPAAWFDLVLLEYKPPFTVTERHRPGDPAVLSFQVTYSAGSDTAILDLIVAGDGGNRVLSVPIAAPGVGSFPVEDFSATLDDEGTACGFIPFVDGASYEVRFHAWDPGGGYAAGRFSLLFHDLAEPFSCYMGFTAVFTSEDVVVVP
jgi:hypothetical protein